MSLSAGRLTETQLEKLLSRVGAGELWSVYLDDTGPAGNAASPSTLPADRKTYLAAIFHPEAGVELMREMPGALAELRSMAAVDEFHFVDIYGGKGPFRDVSVDVRLAIFDFFADVSARAGLQYIVQSFDKASSANVFATLDAYPPGGPFNFADRAQAALFFLLVKVKQHLESQSGQAAIFVDEGWRKDGAYQELPRHWEAAFVDARVHSASSHKVWGLQFADFAAFVLNRSQMLAGRAFKPADLKILACAEQLAPSFLNIPSFNAEVAEQEDGRLQLVVDRSKPKIWTKE